MYSLAYLVAFLFLLIVIGGPLGFGLTFIRARRFKTIVILACLSIPLGIISTILSLILLFNSGGVGAKILGLAGLLTGVPAIQRSVRNIRNFR